MWLQQSVLSSIRDGLIAPTVPIKEMRKQSIEPIGNEITVEVVTAFNGGTMTNQPLLSNTRPAVNVLYGLSGSGRDFMAEFEISLKSVLLNAPLNMDLNVHVLADSKAYSSVGKILQSAKLKGSSWPTQITIHVYNVSPYVNKWSNVVSKLYQKKIGRVTRHTIGAYFRLFSNEVLPQSVEHVVYMDTDVVVMANLGDLWRRIDRNATYTWGKDHCSGFVVFNVKKIPTIWKMAKEYPFKKYASGDQFILKQVGKLHPEVVKYLPSEWAISVANGGLWRRAKHIVEYRPKVRTPVVGWCTTRVLVCLLISFFHFRSACFILMDKEQERLRGLKTKMAFLINMRKRLGPLCTTSTYHGAGLAIKGRALQKEVTSTSLPFDRAIRKARVRRRMV